MLDIAGIRIGADGTWFVLLFVLIFWLSGSFRSALHSSDGVAYLTTVATVLLFFASLVLHELGHAFAARRRGIGVTQIDLFLFGGFTRMSRDTRTPGEELEIAAAGPAATLLFCLLCLAIDFVIVGGHRLIHAIALDGTVPLTPVLLSLAFLLPMNVLILIFNLIPAYPLDGGRIARAIVWRTTGDRARGTRAAAKVGEGLAIVLAGLGVWALLTASGFEGIWLLVVAFLVGQSARSALRQSAVTERVQGVLVADVMDRQPITIPSVTPVSQALDEYFLRYDAPWLPVVDDDGRFMGISRRDRIQEVSDRGEGWLAVSSVLESDDADALRIGEDQPLTDLLTVESLGRLGAVMAVDAEGVLQGVVTLDRVRRALQTVFATPLR
ncbi:MAG TPA: site-2 protease family protein [Solirubrobacteraceae bacterium]